ncbi:MAG: internal scaffolding protein [Microvirus sp.]|nr:MAG: internal scaffolding protein [Microvirus sp.]
MKIYSAFDPPPNQGIENLEPTMTQQHFQDECDINNILAKFTTTGILETINGGQYLDLSTAQEYRQALHTVMAAEDSFAELPAEIRKEFNNDPMELLQFIHDPSEATTEKGRQLGLFLKPDTPVIDQNAL